MSNVQSIRIDKSWDGGEIHAGEAVELRLAWHPDRLTVEVDAPLYGDPPPASPPGRCDRLWEYEVVELFLVGSGESYVEFEFGPWGHFLGYRLEGVRHVIDSSLPVDYEVRRTGDRWSATAVIPRDALPASLERWNAFAIHGADDSRQHLAASPVPGDQPDFHRIDLFPNIDKT